MPIEVSLSLRSLPFLPCNLRIGLCPLGLRALACPEIGFKWFLFFFCLFGSNMGLFDGQILAVLREINHGGSPTNPPRSGVFHTQTPREGINTIFDHFRDKPARSLKVVVIV